MGDREGGAPSWGRVKLVGLAMIFARGLTNQADYVLLSNIPTKPDGKTVLQLSLNCPSFGAVKSKPPREFRVLEGRCAGTEVCPLSQFQAGAVVCIKRLSAAPDVTDRLRELGICEEQRIKLLARQSNYICQVCNARLAISGELADSILVQEVPASSRAA